MRIVRFLFMLAVVAIGAAFAVLNAEAVQLNYYLGSVELPLALVLTGALALGALFGVVASLGSAVRLRRELASLRKTHRLDRQEIDNLRALPIKD